MNAHYDNFQWKVLPVLVKNEIGVLGMKPMVPAHDVRARSKRSSHGRVRPRSAENSSCARRPTASTGRIETPSGWEHGGVESKGEVMKVGFIGLGHMGAGMAANLLRADHEVTIYNRTAGKERALIEHGARAATHVADACRGEVVITMLTDDGAVESVVFGDNGVIGSLRKGAIHVSTSTISVALSERLTAVHAKAGQRFVAAPVFGRPDVAAAGRLFIMAAGAKDAVNACRPLFDVLGQKTLRFSWAIHRETRTWSSSAAISCSPR